MDKYREIKDRFIVGMANLRVNFHPNHSYALYVQPGRSHDIYQDTHKVVPATETLYSISAVNAESTEIFDDEKVRELPVQPAALFNRWSDRDSSFAVRATIHWENERTETLLVWLGDFVSITNKTSRGSLSLTVSGTRLTVFNGAAHNITSIDFLLGVVYPITVTPCILKQVVDIFNVQDEFGPDAGALFDANVEKLPYTVTMTTTYLDRAGIDPLHDDWLIIDGTRYVVSRIRVINRSFKTAQELPSVFSMLVYPEKEPAYLLEEKQPMDFIQVTQMDLTDEKMTLLLASGLPITHYRYYDSYVEGEKPVPDWVRLKEAYYFDIKPSALDLVRGQCLIGFKIGDKEVKKIITFDKGEVVPDLSYRFVWEDRVCNKREGYYIPQYYTPIYTVEDWYAMSNKAYGIYLLMNDLDFTGFSERVTISADSVYHQVSIYGQGYTIKNVAPRQMFIYVMSPSAHQEYVHFHLQDVVFKDCTFLPPSVGFIYFDNHHLPRSRSSCTIQGCSFINFSYLGTMFLVGCSKMEKCLFENCNVSLIWNSWNETSLIYATPYEAEDSSGTHTIFGDVQDVLLRECTLNTNWAGYFRSPEPFQFLDRLVAVNCINTGTASTDYNTIFGGGLQGTTARNCVAINCDLIGGSRTRITFGDASDCYSTPMASYPNPQPGISGEGTTVTRAQVAQQSFYEPLGFDFDNVWRMNSGGYPEFKPSISNSGKAIAKRLKVEMVHNTQVVVTHNHDFLEKFKGHPALTETQYQYLPLVDVQTRGTDFLSYTAEEEEVTDYILTNAVEEEDTNLCPF